MATMDHGTDAPRCGDGRANSEGARQQPNNDGKSNHAAASPFRLSQPMGIFPTTTTNSSRVTHVPSFGEPSPVRTTIKSERPSLAPRSSFSEKAETEVDTPPTKRMKLDFTDVLQIQVSAEKRAFYVPRKLAISRSTFITTAAQNAFSTWLQITFQGQVVIEDEETVLEKEQLWALLVRTYLLAAKLGDPQSMNATMDEIVRRLRTHAFKEDPIAQAVKYTFEHTASGCKLRRVFVDYAVYRTTDRKLFSDAGSNDFLFEVIKEYMNWRDIQPTPGPAAFGRSRGKFGEDLRQYHVKESVGTPVKR